MAPGPCPPLPKSQNGASVRPVHTEDLARVYHRIEHFWNVEIWASEPDASRLPYGLRLLARVIHILVTGFRRERIKLRAASLTLVSLLSLVPVLAVVYSILRSVVGLESIVQRVQAFITQALAVADEETIRAYLDRFTGQANSGALGTFGALFLLAAVVSLLTNIEKSFNDIWGLSRGRRWVARFQVYWPLVTLGPILLGLSLSATAALGSSTWGLRAAEALGGAVWIGHLTAVAMTFGFFFLLYIIMPNTSVSVRAAATGALFAAILWVLAQWLFTHYARNAIAYSAIYGSLGVIPLFILWLYVSWIVALVGAAVAFSLQSVHTYRPGSTEVVLTPVEQELVAVELLFRVARAFVDGQAPVDAQTLVDAVQAPGYSVRKLLDRLVESGVILVATAVSGGEGFVPARPVRELTAADAVRALRGPVPVRSTEGADASVVDWYRSVESAQAEFDRALMRRVFAPDGASAPGGAS